MHEVALDAGDIAVRYDQASERAVVVAAPGAGSEAACRAAALAGYRTPPPIDPMAALIEQDLIGGAQMVLLEVADLDWSLAEPLLATIGALAEAWQIPLIATVALAQIDGAAALLPEGCVLQCQPSDSDRMAAALLLRPPATARLHDSARDADMVRMRRFQEEVARIAESLARLSRADMGEVPALVRNDSIAFRPTDDEAPSAQEIRRVIRARRMRADYFQAELFADPAWDMLLDLFASELEHRQVSVSSLCIAAAVPPTTALRWIGTMNESGLFERRADTNDRRRAYIGLTDRARDGMLRYVNAVKRAGLNLA